MYVEATAFLQWLGSAHESFDIFKKTLPTSWLCVKMEQCRTYVGLPVSWFAI